MIADVLPKAKAGRRKGFSLVPQLDQYPWLVRFVQTILGKIVLLALFSLLISFYWPQWVLFLAISLGFCLFLPGQRHIILVVASLGSVLIGRTNLRWSLVNDLLQHYGGQQLATPLIAYLAVGGVIVFCALVLYFSKGAAAPFRIKRPVLAVLSFYIIVAMVASYAPLGNQLKIGLWSFLVIFGNYIWFLCYSLCERNDPQAPPFSRQLGYYLPFWYPSPLPLPKGASYLRKIRAETPEDLAICQLKGLKLLLWAIYLSLFGLMLEILFFGFAESYSSIIGLVVDQGKLLFFFRDQLTLTIDSWPFFLDIPTYSYAFEQCAAGKPLLYYWNWAALVIKFFLGMLHLAIITHAAIAICRMAGYNALRNVYKPLQSKTIAGFWNRYYYYYKELLVTVFFYPTFLRYFKGRPALRLYMATLAAAGLGNFLYHFILKIDVIVGKGVWVTFVSMQPFMFYCFLLVNSIFISQWRRIKAGPQRKMLPQPLPLLMVLSFYCVLEVFADTKGIDIMENFKFVFALFNFTTNLP